MTATLPPHDAFLSWLAEHMGDDLPSTLQRMDMRQAFDAGCAAERQRIRDGFASVSTVEQEGLYLVRLGDIHDVLAGDVP